MSKQFDPESDRKVAELRDKLGVSGMLAALSQARLSCGSLADAIALAHRETFPESR